MREDNKIVEYLITSGLIKIIAYTDKTFLFKLGRRNYRYASKKEIKLICMMLMYYHNNLSII